MKKLIFFAVSIKAFASMIFTGLMILYMVSGFIYSTVTGVAYDFAIPFVFVLQGLILTTLISLLWSIMFCDTIIKKWRYCPRLIVFSLSLMVLLAICLLTFVAIPTAWAKLWLLSTGGIGLFVIVLSIISEKYFKATGKHYTTMLKDFQEKI